MQLGEFGIGPSYSTLLKFFFILIIYLDIVMILKGEILSWSLTGVKGVNLCYCHTRFPKKINNMRWKETTGTYRDMFKLNMYNLRKYTLDLKTIHSRPIPIYPLFFATWLSAMEKGMVSVEPRWKRYLGLLCKAPRTASNFITSSLEKCFYRWVTSILPSIAGTGIATHGWNRIVLMVK